VTSDPVPAELSGALAQAGLPPVRYFSEIGSTNDTALDLAAAGAPDFTAVLADVQHAGRGRRGRPWSSPAGAGMYLSVVVRTQELDARVPLVTLAAGVAVAEAIVAVSGLPVEVKWPNDIVIGRPWRKLAGILCEATALGTPQGAVVVGMGVNLLRAAYPPEVADRATSLGVECDRPIQRSDLVVACLVRLREGIAGLRADQARIVLTRWREFGRAGLDAAPVRWQDERGPCRGIAVGLADDGALLVRRHEREERSFGDVERLIAGDVIWETLSRV
jgi:BirA family biotin operon repressor/biotin-[acetyl-CoA-carboxylase] ligase